MGDLEICGFVIRGFPFAPKSANCKDSLYFSNSILSLELDFECRIPKFCHSWNLLGIMWNSGISLEVDYILPNLTYLVSIRPNEIILYPFGVSLDLWSLEFGDPKILESPGFGKFQHVVYFPNQFVSRTLIFIAELQRSIILGIFQELAGTLEFIWKWPLF